MAIFEITSPVDGAVVRYDSNPALDWDIIPMHQCYMGGAGLNKRVPKVKDWVVVAETRQTFICDAVNEMTLVPTLRDITTVGSTSLTAGAGSAPDTYRATFDETEIPYRMSIDPRFFVYGIDAQYVRVYRGTDVRDETRIISVRLDNQGNVMSNNIQLVDAARHNITGIIQKSIPPFNVNTYLSSGELITVVYFTSQNKICGEDVLRVYQSTWIAPEEQDTRYITHISLMSPYLSKTVPNLLEVPVNVQLDALNMYGLLHYSDGSISDPQPVDNTKFKMLGIENFIGVWPSQKARLTLVYNLSPTEAANGSITADGKKMVAPYDLITTEQKGAYSLKLAGFPTWNSTEHAYRLKWFMTDLSRQTMLDVTPYVYFNEDSDIYSGTLLGQGQRLSVRLNLKDISASYPSYIHTQYQTVILDKTGDKPGPNWRCGFDINQDPLFGTNLYAQAVMVNQNLWRVNVRFGATNINEWLNRIFYDSRPIYYPNDESRAPLPTHMVIFRDNVRTEVAIDKWDTEFQVSVNFSGQSNIQIEFIRRTGSTTLRLGVVCMPIKTS